MIENEIAREVVDAAFHIHKNIGPGLFESVYENILEFELTNRGLSVERQKPVPVIWKDLKMDHGFRSDLIVNGRVLIEIKSIESIGNIHIKQVLTYLQFSGLKLGLLINFNVYRFKDGIRRLANNL